MNCGEHPGIFCEDAHRQAPAASAHTCDDENCMDCNEKVDIQTKAAASNTGKPFKCRGSCREEFDNQLAALQDSNAIQAEKLKNREQLVFQLQERNGELEKRDAACSERMEWMMDDHLKQVSRLQEQLKIAEDKLAAAIYIIRVYSSAVESNEHITKIFHCYKNGKELLKERA